MRPASASPHATILAGTSLRPLDPALAPFTDLYFRGYDQNYPDLWRYNEWKREFDQFVANGNLPNLSLVRISHDHMGSFGSALGGFNTPETQQADCDLALGLMVEAVANSRYASDTQLRFRVERRGQPRLIDRERPTDDRRQTTDDITAELDIASSTC